MIHYKRVSSLPKPTVIDGVPDASVLKEKEFFMTISFECVSNTDMPWINVAVFQVGDEEIIIDRDRTEWTYDKETKNLAMDWRHVYIWNGEDINYQIPKNFLDYAILKELEIEDDAPEDYEIECLRCYFDGVEVPVIGKSA